MPESLLPNVKMLLGFSGTEQDSVLTFVIETVLSRVLRYINHETLPEPLEHIVVLISVSYYKSAGLGSSSATPGTVSSVKRGDVQTSFATGAGSASANTFNLGDGDDFFGWRSVLNQYRKPRWQ